MSTLHTGRLGNAAMKFETTWATGVTGDRPLRISTESIKAEVGKVEDEALIGEVFSTQRVKVSENYTGSLSLMAHPEELGPLMYWGLGAQATASDPNEAHIVITYVGSVAYANAVLVGTNMTFNTSTDGITYTPDLNVGTAGVVDLTLAAYDTAAELAAYFEGLADYRAYYIGLGTSDTSQIAAFSATIMKDNGVHRQSLILGTPNSGSTTAKTHVITPADASTKLPSASVTVARTLGTNESVKFVGTKVTTAAIAVSAADMAKVDLSVSAYNQENSVTDLSLTIPEDKAYVAPKICLIINGIKMTEVKDLSLNINGNLTQDNVLCDYRIIEQIRQKGEITISGTMNLNTDAADGNYQFFANNYLTDQEVEMIVLMENQDNADTTNDIPFQAVWRLNKVDLDDYNTTLEGPGIMTIPFSGLAVNSNDYETVEITVVDDETTDYA